LSPKINQKSSGIKRKNHWFENRSTKKILVVYIVFMSLYGVGAFLSPSFRTLMNMHHLLSQVTPLVIVGIAQSLVLLTGGFDLSLGSIITLANVAAASIPLQDSPLGILIWLLVPLSIGLGAGALNGVLIGKGNFPPIIVTLATSSVFMGIALFWMPIPGGFVSPAIATALTGNIGPIPVPLILFLGVTMLVWFFLRYTTLGRTIYIIGGSEQVASRVGINVGRTKIFTYAIAGLIASFAGIFLAARMYSGDTAIGAPYVLDSIAVGVIGGTRLGGGEGGIIGVIAGAFILNLLNNILNMLGISTFYQYIMKGIILIVSVAITSVEGEFSLRLLKRKITHKGKKLIGET